MLEKHFAKYSQKALAPNPCILCGFPCSRFDDSSGYMHIRCQSKLCGAGMRGKPTGKIEFQQPGSNIWVDLEDLKDDTDTTQGKMVAKGFIEKNLDPRLE
jgi:hypothetical protein